MRKSISLMVLATSLFMLGCPASENKGKGVKADVKADAKGDVKSDVKADVKAGGIAFSGEGSKIEFTGSKPGGKHDGGFKTFTGSIELTGNDVATAKINVDIDTDSLYSDDPKLTGHLKAPDFFNVKSNPKATFQSKSVAVKDAGHEITGDLTLLGKTKSITFPAKLEATADAVKINGEFKIDRTDFGMTYGKGKVDDAVTIKINVNASRKK